MFMEVSQTFHRNNFLYFFLLVCQRTQVPCEEGVQWVQSTIVHSTSSTILCIQFLIFLPVGISKATCRPLKGWTNFINKTVYWEHRGNVHQRKYKLYRVSLKKRGSKKKKDDLNNIIFGLIFSLPLYSETPCICTFYITLSCQTQKANISLAKCLNARYLLWWRCGPCAPSLSAQSFH